MEPLLAVHRFEAFGLSHGVAIVVFAVVAVALVVLGRRHRDSPTERQVSRALALVFVALLVPAETYSLWTGEFGIGYSLPLQLCDLASVAAVWALWSRSSTPVALTYFWGLTLTVQAFVSPSLDGPDFPSPEFLSFFALHSLVVWAAIYLTWGVGLRPNWRNYRVTVLVTIAWVVVILAFNHVAGTNYGFLSAKPAAGSVLDVLGPWPWYILSGLVVTAAVWALMTFPWVRRTHSAGSAGLQTVELPR